MPARDTGETRAVTLADIPLVRRLSDSGTVLDSELCFTQDEGQQGPALFTLLLPYRGVHTMVARADKQQVVGQFRLQPDSHYAHIVYVAPRLEEDMDDTAWLYVLDAMAVEAGKRSAHILVAEVEETAALFKTLRKASYSIYARQEIWRRIPGDTVTYEPKRPVEVTPTTVNDLSGIHLLYGNIVPRLVQPITELPGDGQGFVYRREDRLEGYIGVAIGKTGIYLTPHLHPDVFSDAADILTAVINRCEGSNRLPVYVRVRRYQDWLDNALNDLSFELCGRQAVMVKHIAAGVRDASFAPIAAGLKAVHSPAKPPPTGISEIPPREKPVPVPKVE